MKRRETLKTLLVGTVAGTTLGAIGCKTDQTDQKTKPEVKTEQPYYGRTPNEIEHDQKVMAETFLNTYELETIAVLCDIILPSTPDAGSATDAEVPAFIEFIVKDLPVHQIPIRGGLMWLHSESNKRFDKPFLEIEENQQIQIIDDIAYPDPEKKRPDLAYGIQFFNRMRNLTLTGYYTTRMGLEELGYDGNRPNIWDGVPEDVLKVHDVDYDPEWLAKCVDQNKREVIATWDDDGNLIS